MRALENKYVDDAINVYTLRVFLFAGKRATEERIFCRGKEGEARRRLWKCSELRENAQWKIATFALSDGWLGER